MATSYGKPPAPEPKRAKALDVRARPKQLVRHLRAPVPIHFPETAEVPEGKEHLEVRTFLYKLLQYALGPDHSVGSEQFIYWNARDKHRCLSPDVFVRLGVANRNFATWKTWEQGGVPELAVEIISPNERPAWEHELVAYHELGVQEVVWFDPQAPEGARLRVWDRVQEDLVEREVLGDTTPCQTLGLTWVVREIEDAPFALRLLDEHGDLVLDARETEARAREAETRAREAETARADAEAHARAEAEARVRALEEERRRRG